MDYWIWKGGDTMQGPFSVSDLSRMAETGAVKRDDILLDAQSTQYQASAIIPFPSQSKVSDVQKIEATGKKYKLPIAIGGTLFLSSIVLSMISAYYMMPMVSGFFGMTMFIGIVIYVSARVGAWWNHG